MNELLSKINENLPIFYKNVVADLLKNIKNSNIEEQRKLFDKFSRKFTMIPDLWKYWEQLERDADKDMIQNQTCKRHVKLRRRSYKHFYWEDETWTLWACFRKMFPCYYKTLSLQYLKCIKYRCKTYYLGSVKKEVEALKQALTFPNSNLEKAMKLYQKYSASPITKDLLKKYQKSLLLYQKIMEVEEENVEEWIECLKETKDTEFIIQSFEFRLGKNPCDNKFWKLYIGYLNSTNNQQVLRVYRRHCRLFIEDKESLQEYRNQIYYFNKREIDVFKFLVDTIKFEVEFNSVNTGFELLQKALNSIKTYSKPFFKFAQKFAKKYGNLEEINFAVDESRKRLLPMKRKYDTVLNNLDFTPFYCWHFSFNENPQQQQHFPFRSTFMAYINANANFIVTSKFIKSCKYFCNKNKKTLFIWDLRLDDGELIIHEKQKPDIEFSDDSLFAIPNHPVFESIKKIWIGRTLIIKAFSFTKCRSSILPKLICQDMRYLDISGFRLTIDEFCSLTSSKKISKAKIGAVILKSEDDDSLAAREDVFAQFPNAYSFDYQGHIYPNLKNLTAETTRNLANLERNVKLKTLKMDFNYLFNPSDFCEFLIKNAAPNAKWYIVIIESLFFGFENIDYRNLVKNTIDHTLLSWEPQSEKPVVDLNFY